MKKHIVVLLCITILLLILLVISPTTLAALDAFDLNWWTVDSGGGQSNGGNYSILGVAGQPDAGVVHGGDFILAGGFLSGVTAPHPPVYNILLPLVIK
jgi:hypothetical protein